jgi:AraC-like DNA-binding protein
VIGISNTQTLRMSTDEMAERDRLPFIREIFGRLVVRQDIEPIPGTDLRVDATFHALPGLSIWTGTYSPVCMQRTRELLADGNDGVSLCVDSTGGTQLSHLGKDLTVAADSAVLLSAADVISIRTVQLSGLVGIVMSRKTLISMVPTLEGEFMRPVPKESEALRLLKSYIEVVKEGRSPTTPELEQLVATHIYDLAALTLGATRDSAEVATGRGVRAARLRAIKADILKDPSSPEMTLTSIAARHRVTPRYVQLLFHGEGTTFSQYLLDQRLARAHRMLGDARADLKISTIAFDAGFGDLSHFNRSFRRRYGDSPSDVRDAALRVQRA